MSGFKPLHDRVLLSRYTAADRTPGGIFIPENAKKKPLEAKVIAAGTGRMRDDGTVAPMSVKEGDSVLIGSWTGTEIEIEGAQYIVVREDEILGIRT